MKKKPRKETRAITGSMVPAYRHSLNKNEIKLMNKWIKKMICIGYLFRNASHNSYAFQASILIHVR